MIIYKMLCPISKARLGGDQRIFLECSGKTQSTGRFCLVYMGLKKKKKKKEPTFHIESSGNFPENPSVY